MKKIFISQFMKDKTDEQILRERKAAIEKAEEILGEPVEVIDSFFQEMGAPNGADRALWILGESLKLLSTADIACFASGWESGRGCKIEYLCAVEYGIGIIDLEECN